MTFTGELHTEFTGVHAFRVKVLDGEAVVARQDFAFLCGAVELLAVETERTEYPRGDETIRGVVHLYGEGCGEVELSLDGEAVALIPVTLSGATALPFTLEGSVPALGRHTITVLYRGPQGSAGGVSTSFLYGAGLPDLSIAAIEVGKEPTTEGRFPVTVVVEKERSLPAAGVRVRVYHDEALLGEYSIELLEEEGARHRGTILWAPGEFSGRAVITAEVSLMDGAKEFDTMNNAAAVEVEIPQKPVLDGFPAVMKEASFPISGRTSPGALVLLYRDGEVFDFASADGDGFFTFSDFRLPEGISHLSLKAHGGGGRESLESEIFTVFVDSVPPKIWPLNIAQGYAYNYDLVPEVVIGEENLAEVVYTLDGLAWTPGTPVTTEGEHLFHVRVVDRAGNEAELALSFAIDKTLPVIRVENIVPGAYHAAPVEPAIEIDEEHPDSVEVLLNGEIYPGGEIAEDGVYDLLISALDQAGNSDYYQVEFTIDRTPPRIAVLGVADGGIYTGPVVPEIQIEEANPERTEILLDGVPYEPGTPIAASGTHHLAITAVDLAGNLSTVELWFTVDMVPPTTRAELAGDRWSDGIFKSPITVSLTAEDDPGGSGVAGIYYFLDGGAEERYTGPFTVTGDGVHFLRFQAVDRAGNSEAAREVEIRIAQPWTPAQTLLCRELVMSGNAKATEVFVDGPVTLKGNVTVEDLGTTAATITKTGNVRIGRLETAAPYRPLPVPDWEALRAVTALQQETQLTGNLTLSNVRFAGNLAVSGNVKISGILFVEGDLTIAGNLNLQDVAVFCRGEVRITGNASITGLIYAGRGLRVGGNPSIKGLVVVDGRAEITGNLGGLDGPPAGYVSWLRAGE